MGRYLRAAFWIGARVPGLGRLPVNALALAGLLIMGFGHQGFWFLGLGLEAAWLLAATSSSRFRALVDAGEEQLAAGTSEEQRQALVLRLGAENRQRLALLEKKCERALALQHEAGGSAIRLELNGDSLHKLTWFFLKLLVARENLQVLGDASMRRDLEKQVQTLQSGLEGCVSPALRESKDATLKILQRRLAHVDRREESIAEFESDLTRIEAQIDLAVDRAGLSGKDGTISTDLHFVSQFLDEGAFGEAGASIAALDQTYAEPPRRKATE